MCLQLFKIILYSLSDTGDLKMTIRLEITKKLATNELRDKPKKSNTKSITKKALSSNKDRNCAEQNLNASQDRLLHGIQI